MRPSPSRLAAVTAVVTLLAVACANAPDDTEDAGAAPTASSDALDPADAPAMVAEAIATVTEASGYQIRSTHLPVEIHASGIDDPAGAMYERGVTVEYSDQDEPTILYMDGGEGGYSGAYRSGDAPVVHGYMLDPIVDEDPPEAVVHMTDFAAGAHKLREIADTSEDLAYEGTETLDGRHHTFELFSDRLDYSEHDWSQDPVEGHRYTGTFSASHYVDDQEGQGWLLEEHPGTEFVLWLSEDGRPLQLDHTTESTHVRSVYSGFDEPMEIEPLEPFDWGSPDGD